MKFFVGDIQGQMDRAVNDFTKRLREELERVKGRLSQYEAEYAKLKEGEKLFAYFPCHNEIYWGAGFVVADSYVTEIPPTGELVVTFIKGSDNVPVLTVRGITTVRLVREKILEESNTCGWRRRTDENGCYEWTAACGGRSADFHYDRETVDWKVCPDCTSRIQIHG